MNDANLTELIYTLTDREKQVLKSAALSASESEFISICKLYLPHISFDQARSLREAARAGRL